MKKKRKKKNLKYAIKLNIMRKENNVIKKYVSEKLLPYLVLI